MALAEGVDALATRVGQEIKADRAALGLKAPAALPGTITGPGRYDPTRSLYNATGTNLRKSRTQLAKAAANTALFEILCIGPSTTQGYPNVMGTQSYPAYLQSFLSARGLPATQGWVPVSANLAAGVDDARWAFSAGWTKYTTSKDPLWSTSTAAATATFTSLTPGTVVEFTFIGTYGNFTYNIDGTGAVAVAAGGGATQTRTITVTGLPNTVHQLVITFTSGTALYVQKARVRGATGIQISQHGWGGSASQDWDQTLVTGNDVYYGLQATSVVGTGYTPHLVVLDVAMWINDLLLNAWTQTQSRDAITRIVQQYQARGCDVVMLNNAVPSTTVQYQTYPVISDATTQAYRQMLYGVADTCGVPMLDTMDRIGNWATANTNGLMADALHFTPSGYAAIATSVERSILLDAETIAGNVSFPTYDAAVTDEYTLTRLERETEILLRAMSDRMQAAVTEAKSLTEVWSDTRNWTGTGTVASGRVYSSTGLTRPIPTSTRWVARATFHSPGTAGKFAYFGIGDGTNTLGVGQTSSSSSAFVNRSAGINASAVVIPRTMPTLTAGDYLVTIAKDETHYSLTLQPAANAGQAIYGCRVKITDMPLTPTVLFFSANDTTVGGLNWGPAVIYEELAVPPVPKRTAGGVALFGAGRPLAFWRADPTTGFGHMVHIPGDNDPRQTAPLCLFLHQSLSGLASNIYTESRFTNVLSALETAGYIIASSDNGPNALTAGGTQDRYGNQSGLDDYAALTTWIRTHQNTGGLFLVAPSMGNFFAENMLQQRTVGGISAVAGISTGYDLAAGLANPTYTQFLLDAYGATDANDFANKTANYDPARQPGWKFRGVPWRLYSGDADTTAPPATTAAWAAKIAPYVPEASIVTVTGVGHLDASLYQGANIVAFFNKYAAAPKGAVVTLTGPTDKRDQKNQAIVTLQSGVDYIEKFDIVSDGTSSAGWPNRREIRATPVGGGAPRLVQYDNEYGERRLVARQNTVLWRAFGKELAADTAHDVTVPVWEIQDNRETGTRMHGMFSDGNAYHKGALTVDGAATVGGNMTVTGTVNGKTLGVQIQGVYNTGSEPTGQPTGTIILVRP